MCTRLPSAARAVDAPLAALCRQPRAGPDSAYGGQRRRVFRARHGSKASAWTKYRRRMNGPSREAVRTFGPAYRYPAAGWIYLHIEGQPYERGYQHGYLMAREIPEYLERCAADLGVKADARAGRNCAPRPMLCFCAASTARFSRRCAASPMAPPRPARNGGPPNRPGRHRGGEHDRRTWANCVRPCGRRRPGWKDCAWRRRLLRSQARFRPRPLQCLRRYRPCHPRRQDGGRPRHLVAADARRADQCHARHQARYRAPHAHAELSGRHRKRHRLVSERCRRGAHGNHDPADAFQRRRARRWHFARAGPYNMAAISTRW